MIISKNSTQIHKFEKCQTIRTTCNRILESKSIFPIYQRPAWYQIRTIDDQVECIGSTGRSTSYRWAGGELVHRSTAAPGWLQTSRVVLQAPEDRPRSECDALGPGRMWSTRTTVTWHNQQDSWPHRLSVLPSKAASWDTHSHLLFPVES